MIAFASALRRRTVLVVMFTLLTGCAGLPTTGSRLDAQALHGAIVADHVGYVKAAIEARVASVNERVPAPVYMEGTPLITIAARAGARRVTAYLIAAGADLNALTPAGETALMLAVYFPVPDSGASVEDHEAVARMLVEAGATLENEPHHYTPLAYAAYQGRDRMIRYLLERGARVNPEGVTHSTYVNTPLMMAAMRGHVSSALLLLRAGADPRVRVVDGHTAAELAAKHSGADVVGILRCAEAGRPAETVSLRC
jgi:ankyrin repeat protein